MDQRDFVIVLVFALIHSSNEINVVEIYCGFTQILFAFFSFHVLNSTWLNNTYQDKNYEISIVIEHF